MAKRQIIDDRSYAHFVTFSVYRRRRLLDLDPPKQIVLGVLNQELKRRRCQLLGFVIMPDHAHAIFRFPIPGQLSAFMHGWKRKSSFRIRNWYREHADHYTADFGEGQAFWNHKYYSFEIYEEAKLAEKLDYMHTNPVRAGLVDHATDWPWSSARWYTTRQSVGVPISSV